jgi:hypothetical protein
MTEGSPLVALVGEEIKVQGVEHDVRKWWVFVNGNDGFLYGIPYKARRVVKFNPVDKSMEMIGPDLGENDEWTCGILAKNGCIYCPPNYRDTMLKINTIAGTVETIDLQDGSGWWELPFPAYWVSGAVGRDECIYYLPSSEYFRDILRLDPDTDTLSLISLPSYHDSFRGAVVGKDDCIYGIPKDYPDCVMRFDPMEPENISYISGSNAEFKSDGVLGCDGNIYALIDCGYVLKLDTSARTVSFIRNDTFEYDEYDDYYDPVVGPDQCIYWLQCSPAGIVRFDPVTQQPPSFIVLGDCSEEWGWLGGALADDGVIYYAPLSDSRVLAIDPFRELSATIKDNMRLYPQELGRLFVETGESYRESLFDSAVRKFGHDRAFGLLDECLPLGGDECGDKMVLDGIPLFMLAASSSVGNEGVGGARLDVIYHLMRRNVQGLLSD